jgi:hypothetical protein
MLPNWQKNLSDWIDEAKHKRFAWGVHDCFIFTNTAWRRMTGKGYADEWYDRYYNNRYRPLDAASMRKEFGYNTLSEALNEKLQCLPESSVVHGNLVGCVRHAAQNTTNVALGICLGEKSAFCGKYGLEFIGNDEIQYAWGMK